MTKAWIVVVVATLVFLGGLLFFYHEKIVEIWDSAVVAVEEAPIPELDPDETMDKWNNYLDDVDEDLNSKKEEATKK